jgi:hypothetical protein
LLRVANPVTYALAGMRGALSLIGVGRPVAILLRIAPTLLPSSLAVSSWSLQRTKITGALTHS